MTRGSRMSAAARVGLAAAALALVAVPGAAWAKRGGDDDGGSEGGGGKTCGAYVVTGFTNGASIGTSGLRTTVKAGTVGAVLTVTGKYNTFEIDSAVFGIRNYAFTGAPAADDMTGGKRLLVWQEKTPDLRGAALTGDVVIDINKESFNITRRGGGVTVKIQAKDCASGGIFQMEVQRGDGAATRYTHVLAPGAFYFDNPNFRAREGDTVPYKDTTVVVSSRVNIGSDAARRFVARDSAQVATRVNDETCVNQIATRTGSVATVKHCGRVSKWDVASGGRMGFVTGEDATEVAPPASDCTRKCQAQNRVRGRAVNLGAPFPVPTAARLKPELP